jgi:pimeloyl-ACP methyl ester carboxylesterase
MGKLDTRKLGVVLVVAALAACQNAPSVDNTVLTTAESALTERDIDFNVVLRETGSATIHATVYENPRARVGSNVLAVHGLSETGATFGPLAGAIFSQKRAVGIKRVIAIDLPGHGSSSYPSNLPSGVKFGDLTIEDNVSVVIQAMDALRAQRLAPRVIIGHSMGGLAVQAVQQALLSKGSSLAKNGVLSAILLAPVPAHGQPWSRNASGGGDTSSFIVNDAVLGSYLALPAAVWIPSAFTTTAGTVVPNAPTPEQVAAENYIGVEPLTALFQLTEAAVPLPDGGTVTLQRPGADAGIFAPRNGTRLTVVSFSQDTLVPAVDLDDLYAYLTGDTSAILYRPVTAADAVHGMFISNPAAVVAALRGALQ